MTLEAPGFEGRGQRRGIDRHRPQLVEHRHRPFQTVGRRHNRVLLDHCERARGLTRKALDGLTPAGMFQNQDDDGEIERAGEPRVFDVIDNGGEVHTGYAL
jgi:hypothetical protein